MNSEEAAYTYTENLTPLLKFCSKIHDTSTEGEEHKLR
jgi:hypothetical protein